MSSRVVKPPSKKAAERARLSSSIESKGSDADMPFERLAKTERKLEDDEEAAEEALAKLQEDLAHAVNRLRRIRQIKKKVKERSDEAFRRGIQELDEEDGLLPVLESHERWVESDLAFMGVASEVDWPSLGLGELPEESGVGDTAAAAAGSSGS
ncbi:hypothetical protein BN1723_019077 [Verticillium longisporum]|uniref:Uncharacterized protein n=1 Tax=Verticillium longisporum TaxID=100787 RepID=A0A0G4M8E4_VERLO|nr:hypothetical protein BN1708_018493 [Verticillium longisporum]CRK42923.1 hypothetical protein BN1723_019077 [Verticillium longisporum]